MRTRTPTPAPVRAACQNRHAHTGSVVRQGTPPTPNTARQARSNAVRGNGPPGRHRVSAQTGRESLPLRLTHSKPGTRLLFHAAGRGNFRGYGFPAGVGVSANRTGIPYRVPLPIEIGFLGPFFTR